MKLDFLVPGKPIPQGSLKPINVPKLKYTVLVSDNPQLKSWRKKVRAAAKAAMRQAAAKPFGPEIAVYMQIQFCFLRPKSVDRVHPTVKPDIDKLERAVLDSLTGVVYADDAQVVWVNKKKRYEDFERVEIRVEGMG